MSKITSVLFLITIFFFAGCGTNSIVNNNIFKDDCYNECETDFNNLVDNLVSNICPDIQRVAKKTIYTTDFVNTENLHNSCQLGFLLSSKLKTTVLGKCKTKHIKAIELGSSIKVGSSGVRILSRKYSEIKTKDINSKNHILVGSYTITPKKLILFLNLIDLNTGDIIAASTSSTRLTSEILSLEGKDKESAVYQPLVL